MISNLKPQSGNQDCASIMRYVDGVRPALSWDPICTRCCYTMTCMIQVYSNIYWARVFMINSHPDETAPVNVYPCPLLPGPNLKPESVNQDRISMTR